jgi:hypothetical protein
VGALESFCKVDNNTWSVDGNEKRLQISCDTGVEKTVMDINWTNVHLPEAREKMQLIAELEIARCEWKYEANGTATENDFIPETYLACSARCSDGEFLKGAATSFGLGLSGIILAFVAAGMIAFAVRKAGKSDSGGEGKPEGSSSGNVEAKA